MSFQIAIRAQTFKIPKKSVLLTIGGLANKYELLDTARELYDNGFRIYATVDTYKFLMTQGIKAKMVYKAHNVEKKDSVLHMIEDKKIDFIVNVPNNPDRKAITDGYKIRRKAIDYNVPLITNIQLAKAVVNAFTRKKLSDIEVLSWDKFC